LTISGGTSMKSNLEKYSHAAFVEATKEKLETAPSTSFEGGIVLVPGVFPVCAICGKDCKPMANENYHILIGLTETRDVPLLCRKCRNIVCQECAKATGNLEKLEQCPECGSSEGFDWVIPFAYCEICGKRAALISMAHPGDATYMLLDKGAILLQCGSCSAISCMECFNQTKKCKKCGSSQQDFFVPDNQEIGVIISKIDPDNGYITFSAPGSVSAKSAKTNVENKSGNQEDKIKKLINNLSAPVIKFWINKGKALRELEAMGPACKPALPYVRNLMTWGSYRIMCIRIFAAAGEAAYDELPSLVEMMEKGTPDVAAAAAMAIGSMNPFPQESLSSLRGILSRKRVSGDTGLRCATGLALFAGKEMANKQVTDLVLEHIEKDPEGFPTSDYLETILVVE
jgi:hypothetical protein